MEPGKAIVLFLIVVYISRLMVKIFLTHWGLIDMRHLHHQFMGLYQSMMATYILWQRPHGVSSEMTMILNGFTHYYWRMRYFMCLLPRQRQSERSICYTNGNPQQGVLRSCFLKMRQKKMFTQNYGNSALRTIVSLHKKMN